jgi:hypothetical protein
VFPSAKLASRVSPKYSIGGDVLCFLMQALGGAILANTKSKRSEDSEQRVTLIGLSLQIVVFGLLIVVSGKLVNNQFDESG